MSNYESNDNSTEKTTLREWWGIVRAEFSRVFEILTQNEEIITITKSEIDSCTDVGLYHIVNGEDEIGGSEYYVFTSKYSGTLGMPEVRQIKINDKVYVRTKKSTEEWSEWTEIGAVGEFTSDEGIIFNEKSKALSPNAVAMGPNCTAGGKGFKILGQSGSAEETITFKGNETHYVKINEGETKHIIKNIVCKHNDLLYMIGGKSTYIGGTETEINVSGADSPQYSIWSDYCDATIEISVTIERVGNFSGGKGIYTLSSTEGLEVGMTYSVVNSSGESRYSAGTITAINGNDIEVDGYSAVNVDGSFVAIIGHPELGTDDIGTNAFATGNSTIASSKDQSARGRFNAEDNVNKYADIVGNGTSDEDRSNAYTLDWDGNGWFKGTVTVGVNKDKLATEAFVSEQLPFIGNSVTGGTYKVKRHVGETIPNGTSVILKYVHSPSGNCYNTDGSAQVTTVDPDVNYNGKIIMVGEDVVASGWTGLTIGSIGDWDCTGSEVGYYDENWYAVFEVTTKGAIPTLEERIAALEAVIANIQNAEETSF